MENEARYLNEANTAAFHWYQQADTKAQVLLGFSGLFLSILVASLFSVEDTKALFSRPGSLTMLGAVMVGHLLAICLSVATLWSRGIWFDNTHAIDFFGRIANYEDAERLSDAIRSTTDEELLSQGAVNLHILSGNTKLKHRLVDIAAAVSSLSLVGTVVTAVYIVTG